MRGYAGHKDFMSFQLPRQHYSLFDLSTDPQTYSFLFIFRQNEFFVSIITNMC